MKIVLVDLNSTLCAEWERAFADVPGVEVHNGPFQGKPCTALVSPANSFGHMGGGIDGAYTEEFGRDLPRTVQAVILAEHDGELPVGKAFSVPIPGNDPDFKWLVVAPTMRTPMSLQGTANVYLAARAAFREARRRGFDSVLVPGMGTGAGGVDPATCADHMRAGYDAAMETERPRVLRFREAADELSKYTIGQSSPFTPVSADPGQQAAARAMVGAPHPSGPGGPDAPSVPADVDAYLKG